LNDATVQIGLAVVFWSAVSKSFNCYSLERDDASYFLGNYTSTSFVANFCASLCDRLSMLGLRFWFHRTNPRCERWIQAWDS
jgi:hypothetical protein